MTKLFFLIGLAACWTAQPPTTPSNVESPATPVQHESRCAPTSWNATDMALLGDDRAHAQVLAWISAGDDRPFFWDTALVWVPNASVGGTIVNVYRHPKEDNTWTVARIYDVPDFAPSAAFDHVPTRAEADDFFVRTMWEFGVSQSTQLLGGGVCAPAWKTAFGTAPWRSIAH